MQVVAFSSPSRPEWRWRIVGYSGEMVEESYETFASITTAITEGTHRMNQLSHADLVQRTPNLRSR
jgi:hypothetical protein